MRRLLALVCSLACVVFLLAVFAPRASAQTIGGGQVTTMQSCGDDCPEPPPPPPPPSPPNITILSPATGSGTRTPVVLVSYSRGGTLGWDALDTTTLAVTWGGVDIRALGRHNGGLFEWEVSPQYQLTQGVPKTLSVTICSSADLCTTQTRTTTLPSGNAPILSVTPMPFDAAGGGPSLPFGPGFAIRGPELLSSISTPAYYSWDTPHTAGLTYSTRQSYPRVLVNVDLEFPGALPSTLTMKLWDGAVVVQQFTQVSPSCSSGGQQRCRVTMQADYLSSSSYPAVSKSLKVEALATIGGTQYSTVDFVRVVLVDRRVTPYGSGWWPSGVARLVPNNGSPIIVSADGSATLYLSYMSPPGDRSTLVEMWSQYTGFLGWELRFRDGGKLTFDTQGRMTASEGPNPMFFGTKVRTLISYNGTTDEVYRITDPAGKYFEFGYSGGRLATITDPGQRQTAVTISNNRLLSVTPPTPTGHNYTQNFEYYQFTGSAALAYHWNQGGAATQNTITYGANWRPHQATLPAVLDENGSSVHPVMSFYAQELLGLGVTYGLDSLKATFVDPRGHWAAWTQNRWGQTLRAWDAVGTSAVNTYSLDGLPLTSEGRAGDSTRVYRTYDALGRLVRTYRLRSDATMLRLDSLVWNTSNRIIKRIDTFGNWTAYVYNEWGEVTSAISSTHDTTINCYNGNSRLTYVHRSGSAGNTLFYYGGSGTWGNTDSAVFSEATLTSNQLNTYDAYGRLSIATSRTKLSPNNYEWRRRLFYNNIANQSDSVRLERSGTCAYPCSSANWPSPSDTLLTRTIRHVFSYLGRDSLLLGPTGAVEEASAFDALGRLVSHSVAGSPAETFRYDAAGNLRFHVTRRGYQVEAQYDSRGRLSRRLAPTVGNFSYVYGGPNDELTSAAADAGYADAVGGSNPNLAWSYNQSGQLTSETTQGNRTTTYSYDTFYRVSSYTDALGTWQVRFHAQRGTPDTLISPHGDHVAYGLDDLGRLAGPWIDGAGVDFSRTTQWRSDGTPGGLLNQIGGQPYVAGTLADTSASDLVAARWTEQHGSGDNLRTESDSTLLDGWGRVTHVDYRYPYGTYFLQAFSYSAAGNMTIGSVPWTYSAVGNRLLSGLGVSYAYDNSGNDTVQYRNTYALFLHYDALERMVSVDWDYGHVSDYSYDALGQRIAKKMNGNVERFVWRGGHVAYETNDAGTVTRSYTWGSDDDDLLAIHDHMGGGHYYVVQDKMRSVRALVDAAGTWRASWRYTIYGDHLYESGQVPFSLRFRWAGAQYDGETGFYYMRSRYYYPEPGRFLQEDRAGRAGGMDLYAYATGDPTNARDPSGTQAQPEPRVGPYACLGTLAGCNGLELHEGNAGYIDGGGGGGGGMDWNGDGWDDFAEFTEYSWGLQQYRSEHNNQSGAEPGDVLDEWHAIFDVGIVHNDPLVRAALLRASLFGDIGAYVDAGNNKILACTTEYVDREECGFPLPGGTIFLNRGSDVFGSGALYLQFTLAHEVYHWALVRSGYPFAGDVEEHSANCFARRRTGWHPPRGEIPSECI